MFRGSLFAGRLYAGLLFGVGESYVPPTPEPEPYVSRGGGGGYYLPTRLHEREFVDTTQDDEDMIDLMIMFLQIVE